MQVGHWTNAKPETVYDRLKRDKEMVKLPRTIGSGAHTFQVVDGVNASSAIIGVLVVSPPPPSSLLINGIAGAVMVDGVPLATVASLAETIQNGAIL